MRKLLFLTFILIVLLSCKKTIVEELTGDSFRVSILPISMKNFDFYQVTGTVDVRFANEPVEYGIVYGKAPNPTIDKANRVPLGIADATTDFKHNLSGLDTGATYYVRSYVLGSYDKIEYSANQTISKISPTITPLDTSLHYGRTFSFYINLPQLMEGTSVKVFLNEHLVEDAVVKTNNLNTFITAPVPSSLSPGKLKLSLSVNNVLITYSRLLTLLEGNWSQTDDLPKDVQDGDAFVHGDWIYFYKLNYSYTNTTAEFFKYNYKTRARVALKTFDPTYRLEMSAITEVGGKLHFVTGNWIGGFKTGVPTSRHYVYDIASDEWTREKDFPGGDRYSPISISYEGKLYCGMGVYVNYSGIFPSHSFNDMWCYDPVNKTWRKTTDFPKTNGRDLYSTFKIGSRLYMVGGAFWNDPALGNTSRSKETWCFDAAVEKWSAKADYPGKPGLRLAAFSIGNYGYAGMGESYNDYGIILETQIYKYSPMHDTWTEVSNPGVGRSKPFTGSGDKDAIIGGGTDESQYQNQAIFTFKP